MFSVLLQLKAVLLYAHRSLNDTESEPHLIQTLYWFTQKKSPFTVSDKHTLHDSYDWGECYLHCVHQSLRHLPQTPPSSLTGYQIDLLANLKKQRHKTI